MSDATSSLSDDVKWDADGGSSSSSSSVLSKPLESSGHNDDDDDRVLVPVMDHYNPHDLVKSWTIESLEEGEKGERDDDQKAPQRRNKKSTPPASSNNNNNNNHTGEFPRNCHNNKKRTVSSRLIWTIVAALLIVIVVMVAIIVLVAGNNNSNSNNNNNNNNNGGEPFEFPPTLQRDELLKFLQSISFPNNNALSNTSSPQYAAFAWLAKDPFLNEYSNLRKTQRFVLATLYYSMNHNEQDKDAFLWRKGWLSEKHECQWEFSNNNNNPCHVDNETLVRLDLAGNNHDTNWTQLPPELGLLSQHLQFLNLSDNVILGTLVTELGLLTKLTTLDLSGIHELHSSIGTELGRLTQLTTLDLSDNFNLVGTVPREICRLPHLNSPQVVTCTRNKMVCTCCGKACLQESLGLDDLVLQQQDNSSNQTSSSSFSAQSQAFAWLTMTPQPNHDYERMVQRYVLAVLYYSTTTGGPDHSSWIYQDLFFQSMQLPPKDGQMVERMMQDECPFTTGHDTTQIQQLQPIRVTAFSNPTNANAVIDNDLSTVWTSTNHSSSFPQQQQEEEWILLELNQTWRLDHVNLVWGGDNNYATAYRVEASVSNNALQNNDWITTLGVTRISGMGGTETIPLDHALGRYLRIVLLASSNNSNSSNVYSMAQVSIWGHAAILIECNNNHAQQQQHQVSNLNLQQNQLQGTIPTEIAMLSSSLLELNLRGNPQLQGTIPSELGQLSLSLQTLQLQDNPKLSGTVPSELCENNNNIDITVDCNHVVCSCCHPACH